jgi:hypothetical protein
MPFTPSNGFEPVPVGEATLKLLCDFASGDVRRPLSRVEADWEEVFNALCDHRLIGLTDRWLSSNPSQDYPPLEFRRQIREYHLISLLQMELLYRQVEDILARLSEAGVHPVVLKGPAVAYTVYSDPALRPFGDLDIMLRERDWAVVHPALKQMGFDPEEDLREPPPKLDPVLTTYELKYLHRDNRMLVEVHYHDLLNAGLASRDLEGYWQRARCVEIRGMPVTVLSLEDQLIHLCAHAHYHGFKLLNWFSDLAFLVRDHAGQLDWGQVIKTVRREEAQPAVYYSLFFLERLLQVSPPVGVLDALRPDRLRRWFHERYFPARLALSYRQKWWPPALSFYFLPLYRRLLPDLLVMGRRREKLCCLLRLLFPPRAWLRNYYHVKGDRPISVHYLLHPLKLAYHYLGETARLLRSALIGGARP